MPSLNGFILFQCNSHDLRRNLCNFSWICTIWRPNWSRTNSLWNELFYVSHPYLFIRTIGAVITILVATQTGPDWLISEETGGSIIQLMGILIAWFLAASFLIPLLTEYGIMDLLEPC